MKGEKPYLGRDGKQTKPGKAQTHDDYLARVTDNDKRAALEQLRKAIRAAAPQAEECISYDVPSFRVNGKLLVSYGAAANHCAFYPGSVLKMLKDELRGYDTAQGTIRFLPDEPLPRPLVRRLVQLRIAQRLSANT